MCCVCAYKRLLSVSSTESNIFTLENFSNRFYESCLLCYTSKREKKNPAGSYYLRVYKTSPLEPYKHTFLIRIEVNNPYNIG